MKKFLEVLVDDNGAYHFSTEESFITEEAFAAETDLAKVAHMKEYDNRLRQMIHDVTEFMWRTKDQNVCQAIRMVSMAEILGCAQPYERAEEFWDLMMFHTIPQFEHFAAAIKKQYGFDESSVSRPWGIGPQFGDPQSSCPQSIGLQPTAPQPSGTQLDGPQFSESRFGGPDVLTFPIPQPFGKRSN